MKKGSTSFAGLDVGDRKSVVFVTDASGKKGVEAKVKTTREGIRSFFEDKAPMVVALETGTHSPWISRLLTELGHDAVVANARQLPLIYKSRRKNDRLDAERLAKLVRVDRTLLSEVSHRTEQEQRDLLVVKARASLVECRTRLINHVRGTLKALGERLATCSPESFPKQASEALKPEDLETAGPVLSMIAQLTMQIRGYDRQIEEIARKRYPETKVFRSAPGIGPVTALAFRLVVQSPTRFPDVRDVGPYLGLCPGEDQSGDSEVQKRITKAGDRYLRSLLVSCAHYVLGRHGPDSDLKRWGLKLFERGGKNAKKRAAVAVARKLAVMLLAMWRTGQEYEPFRSATKPAAAA